MDFVPSKTLESLPKINGRKNSEDIFIFRN